MMASTRQQATRGVLWSAIERFSTQGVQFLLGIVIARLLLPKDYGIIAMLSIFLAIAQTFIDGGFVNALIQKKRCTRTDFCTVFYFNTIMSVVLYLILYACAPLIATFYEEAQLVPIIKVIGFTLIINSLGIVQQARLTIALNFKYQAIASLVAALCSGLVGIVLAYRGYGVWTLVIQTLLNNSLRVILLWIFTRWYPSPCFSIVSFKTMFTFGSRLLLSSLLHTLYTNLYTLVIGKKFSPVELGYYNRAFTIAQFPSTNLTNVIVRAMYPIQCRMQDNPVELKALFIKYMKMACYIVFPIMTMLCALSEPLVRIVLTDKWLPVVPLLQLLCIAYMWDPVMKVNHTILNVKGRSDYFLHAEILKKLFAFTILVATLPFGVKVMCAGLIVYAFVDMLIITIYVKKLIDIGIKKQIRKLYPVIMLSTTAGILAYIPSLFTSQPYVQLLGGIITGGISYILFSYLFRFNELKIILSFKQ